MAFLINNLENIDGSIPVKPVNVIKDSRFMSEPNKKPARDSICQSAWNKEMEQTIAFSFERKDIVELAKIISNNEDSPLYIKKTKNSPLYVYICHGGKGLSKEVLDKINMIEAAMFLLIKDEEVVIKDISQAYKLIKSPKSIYSPSKKIIETFHARLGISESELKREEIINKLRETAQSFVGSN